MVENIKYLQHIFNQYKKWCVVGCAFTICAVILAAAFLFKQGVDNQENKLGLSHIDKKEMAVQRSEVSSSSGSCSTLLVDVKGAVQHPGVYDVQGNQRVQAAISSAGGVTESADMSQVNLAQKLVDGTLLYIPAKGESNVSTKSDSNVSIPSGQMNSNQHLININTASAEELQTLTGVGAKKAEKIVAYRQEHGTFKKIEDIKNVSGIGEKQFDMLKDQLTV